MNEAKRLRRPSAGEYDRVDETRLRIIEAAIELFGEHGFDGASTRDIAARAGVNATALQYYFENKEGFLRDCAEYIAHDIWVAFKLVVTRAAEVLRNERGTPTLIDAFIRVLETAADWMFAKSSCESDQRLFFAREDAGHKLDIASEIMMRRVRQPLNEIGSQLLARITGTARDDPVT